MLQRYRLGRLSSTSPNTLRSTGRTECLYSSSPKRLSQVRTQNRYPRWSSAHTAQMAIPKMQGTMPSGSRNATPEKARSPPLIATKRLKTVQNRSDSSRRDSNKSLYCSSGSITVSCRLVSPTLYQRTAAIGHASPEDRPLTSFPVACAGILLAFWSAVNCSLSNCLRLSTTSHRRIAAGVVTPEFPGSAAGGNPWSALTAAVATAGPSRGAASTRSRKALAHETSRTHPDRPDLASRLRRAGQGAYTRARNLVAAVRRVPPQGPPRHRTGRAL